MVDLSSKETIEKATVNVGFDPLEGTHFPFLDLASR